MKIFNYIYFPYCLFFVPFVHVLDLYTILYIYITYIYCTNFFQIQLIINSIDGFMGLKMLLKVA